MVSVSIVTYNKDLEELKKCFSSLTSNIVGKIYIVDNSQQKYIKDFCNGYTNVEYTSRPNIGYGPAHNVAIKKSLEAGKKYYLVLNRDVYSHEETHITFACRIHKVL